MRGLPRRWQRRGIELGERALGLLEAADQDEAPELESLRMRGIDAVAMRFERHACCVERLCGPGEVARDECDLGLGDNTPGAGQCLVRTEGARRAAQESLGPDEVAELRHCDAAQRDRGRVVAQSAPVQCAQRIPPGERPRRGCDQGVHGTPATLVTPAVRSSFLIYLTT